jgi:hypothetical protein
MKTKALQEGVPKGSTFTNKINYSLNKILKTLAKEPKEKQSKGLEHLPKLTREEGRNKP